MTIAYFDCFAGAAGDMITAAMLDAGLDPNQLRSQIATLNIEGLELSIEKVSRCGLHATYFKPKFPHQHHHRHLDDITKIINASGITAKAKQTAVRIFEKLAQAEGKVHGKPASQIHFHEVGAVDSIVDIVSAAIGLQALAIEKIYSSPMSTGSGTVKCAHGLMPVPAPATAELIKGYPTQPGPASRELLTPTAAAILTTLAAEFGPPPPMITRATGYGAGTYESNDFPNTLRLTIGDHLQKNQTDTDTVTVLQTNIDDQSGEILADVQEKLFAAGALDVYTNGIYMKKNRPAVMLSVICAPTDIEKIEQIIFSSGITFGIRKQTCRRTKLVRQIETVQTRFGPIRVKTGTYKGTLVAAKPEFTDCQTAAATHNVPVKTVIAEAFNTFSNRTER